MGFNSAFKGLIYSYK